VRPAAQEEVALVLDHAGLMERGRAADVLMRWVEPIFVGVLWRASGARPFGSTRGLVGKGPTSSAGSLPPGI